MGRTFQSTVYCLQMFLHNIVHSSNRKFERNVLGVDLINFFSNCIPRSVALKKCKIDSSVLSNHAFYFSIQKFCPVYYI